MAGTDTDQVGYLITTEWGGPPVSTGLDAYKIQNVYPYVFEPATHTPPASYSTDVAQQQTEWVALVALLAARPAYFAGQYVNQSPVNPTFGLSPNDDRDFVAEPDGVKAEDVKVDEVEAEEAPHVEAPALKADVVAADKPEVKPVVVEAVDHPKAEVVVEEPADHSPLVKAEVKPDEVEAEEAPKAEVKPEAPKAAPEAPKAEVKPVEAPKAEAAPSRQNVVVEPKAAEAKAESENKEVEGK